ncbi:DGQHR domain-containing protein [Zymomonas mobilis]|uniref:DGQHR domain protein n=1 Tax=Zymomonas mobilis subsp. mobilis (strain ATCC 31821 / ZM4 / CP4) TaxID=264203 RepID=A0A806CE22_ZYMMO|nr:DGQHR domain-containing protein [Zymomonas mobilis]ADC33915.1 DGQHR domain protein [Zymomonas mobilis subsp. mobilis ZM4 = ATCC 31821]AHB11147.1 DGQHR domain-containing protein [Zymomonas mobilis subsp. mobilis str. CP4 = NRRL B-14023]AHJ71389.1 DGQHR domain protein [Zymomonas mobilis subsp. mobilis NRRL B-12526]AHJ73243.1 DGQHR domain protein [Zymomonas mobilis subsp. mobilis str. CP4 = NRRL B-14023]
MTKEGKKIIPALRFQQWLDIWNAYEYKEEEQRKKPDKYLYMFSMNAAELRKFCDVYKRDRQGSSSEGIQRTRDKLRTNRIYRYIKYGYPYGDLNSVQMEENESLRKPGWLPTAIVINILQNGDKRKNKIISSEHLVKIEEDKNNFYKLELPHNSDFSNSVAPFEVIDGQHRLWSFDTNDDDEVIPENFELPVIAFHGLDIAWQAYLFWSINVSPKRINPSHAFDLYPLLRTQDWLERVDELKVYREARAQELTEILYSQKGSPWKERINMLGERSAGSVSQAGWVRSLLATFFSTGKGNSQKGLFQSNLDDNTPLEWSRSQQAAFIIQIWDDIKKEIENNKEEEWINKYKDSGKDPFSDKTSWLNQDQGVRAVLMVTNNLFYKNSSEWNLDNWFIGQDASNNTSEENVNYALKNLNEQSFRNYLKSLAQGIINFDWRSLKGPGVDEKSEEFKAEKRSYRGSGGYIALGHKILKMIADDQNSNLRSYASKLLNETMA